MEEKEIQKSTFEENIQRGINAKILELNEDGTRVTYKISKPKSYRLTDPEELVRASYFVQLVVDYKYPVEKFDFEVTVPRRTPNDWADIVIYEDDDMKKPYLVVECKKDGITETEFEQVIEQVFGNANSISAKLAIVVAGNRKRAFDVENYGSMERTKNIIADIPERYGKIPVYKYVKGQNDLITISREELIKKLESCHDTVWQGGKLAPTTAFDEVSKLLFCKLKDEKDNLKKGSIYKFQIGTHETHQEVYKRIDAIYQKAKQQDAEVFKGNLNLEADIVYKIVEHIQGICFTKTDLDTKGVAFEKFMEDFFKGKMGQFFTPRNVVQFVVKMMDIKNDNFVLDPCCGSGGFLLNALDTIRRDAEENIEDPVDVHSTWHAFAENHLYGIEINDQIARVCKMNMIIHDDGHTNVISRSSLDDFNEIKTQHKGFKKDHFDIIITNPPFGATIKKSGKEDKYLEKFELGKNKSSQKTEVLFIERCIDFLKPKTGRMGIVLPDGILTNSSLQYVRDFIMKRCQILAVVSLPQFAFSHYGAGVKSSLVFLRRKGDSEKLEDYPIFMAIAEKIGYDQTGKEIRENDLSQVILKNYYQFRELQREYVDSEYTQDGNKKCFKVLSSMLVNKRMDPLGYQTRPREIIEKLIDSRYQSVKLRDIVVESFSGDWGEDIDKLESGDFVKMKVLRNKNFDNDFNIVLDDIAERAIPKVKLPRNILQKGDILIEKSGGSPKQPVGRVALIDDDYSNFTFSNFLQCIRINHSVCLPEYLFVVLKMIYDMGYMKYIQSQTTGIINLIMEDFWEIPIPLPKDLSVQGNIAHNYFSRINEVVTLRRKQVELLEENKESLKNTILG